MKKKLTAASSKTASLKMRSSKRRKTNLDESYWHAMLQQVSKEDNLGAGFSRKNPWVVGMFLPEASAMRMEVRAGEVPWHDGELV